MGLLIAILGSSWLLLCRFGPKMAPKMGPQMAPSRPRMGHLGAQEAQAQLARALLEALASKMAPKWLQNGSRWPQVVQDSLLGAFLGLRRLSWKALDPKKPLKTNGLTFALPFLGLRFALVSPLLYLPFSFSFRMGGAPLSYIMRR